MDNLPKDIVRDELAVIRTKLANERTILAYIRSSFAFMAVGVTLIKLFDGVEFDIIGLLFICAGIFLLAFGVLRFRKMNGIIEQEIANYKKGQV